MTRKLCTLAAAILGAAIIAGCGSSSSSSSTSTASSSSAVAATSSAAAASTPASSGGSSAVSSNPEVQQAVAACKKSVNAAPTLSADVKAKLTTLCDKAASGNVQDVKQVAEQVCTEIVKSTVPSSLQSQALAACKGAAG